MFAVLYLGTFADVVNPKCQLEADTVSRSDTRKSGIDNPYEYSVPLLSPTFCVHELVGP